MTALLNSKRGFAIQRDLAVIRSQRSNIPTILGSATPPWSRLTTVIKEDINT